jgi:hypothetical protein
VEAAMFGGRTVLLVIGMLAAATWVGSLVTLAIVSAVARRTLDPRSRVVLFRGVGRLYQFVGTGSLLVAITVGVVLAWPLSELDSALAWEFILSGALVAVSVAGMAQAKRMTVRRRAALEHPDRPDVARSVREGALVAGTLRGLIAAVTFAMVVLAAHLLTP